MLQLFFYFGDLDLRKKRVMGKLSKTILLLSLFSLAGIAVFIVAWDMSPYVKKVERILPDERFPK
jgi:hypothetical protein